MENTIAYILGVFITLIIIHYSLKYFFLTLSILLKNDIDVLQLKYICNGYQLTEFEQSAIANIEKKCLHLKASSGNWFIPIYIAMRFMAKKPPQTHFFTELNKKINSCSNICKNDLLIIFSRLKKYLVIYLIFGSPIVHLLPLIIVILIQSWFPHIPLWSFSLVLLFLAFLIVVMAILISKNDRYARFFDYLSSGLMSSTTRFAKTKTDTV